MYAEQIPIRSNAPWSGPRCSWSCPRLGSGSGSTSWPRLAQPAPSRCLAPWPATLPPTELAKPGSPAAQIAVGGYLGFADRLNTALRGHLGNQVVMRVRADRPSYSVGQTYDTWDGQGWTSSSANKTPVQGGSPYFVSPGEGEIPVGTPDLQTFFVASSTPNLMFHAETATQVWFPASGLYQTADGSMVSPIGLGKGAAYTVESAVDVPAPPTPGSMALHCLGHALANIPVAQTVALVGIAGLVTVGLAWRRRRPKTWAEQVARQIERSGARAGRRRRPEETITEYAAALDAQGDGGAGLNSRARWQ